MRHTQVRLTVDKTELLDAHKVNAKLVDECELHFECKVVGRMPLTKEMLDEQYPDLFYKNDNYHVLYYGEILGTYVNRKGE